MVRRVYEVYNVEEGLGNLRTRKNGTDAAKNITDDVRSAIKKYDLIPAGCIVLAGVSGGPDSVCMLHVLNILKNELNIKIEAAHVNHMLRGDDSFSDEKYVKQLCGKFDIPFHTVKCDIRKYASEHAISLEEAGRDIRYETFGKIAGRTGAKAICVAHNMNDQAETVLMHLLRGAGPEGLKGMEYRNGIIIRPLLGISRARIEEYCIKEDLKPRTDSSNLETCYTRNKIRLKLLPYIKELLDFDPVTSLNRMASLLATDNEFLEEFAADAFKSALVEGAKSGLTLDVKAVSDMHEAVSSRIIRKSILEISGTLKGIEQKHVASVTKLIKEGRTGATICLPQGVTARKSYGNIEFCLKNDTKQEPLPGIKLIIPGETKVPGYDISICTSFVEKTKNPGNFSTDRRSLTQYFDYDAAEKGISIRNRRDGDRIKPSGFDGTKKLKDIFIDKKIPRPERDRILLLTSDDDIIWIVGYEKSDKHKVKESTEKVLAVEVKAKGETPS